jgi:hypothetical protein
MEMEEIKRTLGANIGRRVRIEFVDGVAQWVETGAVDDEDFLHCGPDGGDARDFWTRFESVNSVQAER